MTVGLDTSVALRLVTGTPADQAERARILVATSREPVAVSDLVVSELYFALRHHYAVPHAETVSVMRKFLGDPRIRCSGVARNVLVADDGSRTSRKTGLMDRWILADYARDGVELRTFDRELARLPGARHATDTLAE